MACSECGVRGVTDNDLCDKCHATLTPDSGQVGGDHYAKKPDVYSFSLAQEHDCLQHNACKYITRHKLKNGKEDILKAISLCQRILREQYPDD